MADGRAGAGPAAGAARGLAPRKQGSREQRAHGRRGADRDAAAGRGPGVLRADLAGRHPPDGWPAHRRRWPSSWSWRSAYWESARCGSSWLGLPVLVAALWLGLQVGRGERARFAVTLGELIPAPPADLSPGAGRWGRWWRLLTSRNAWRHAAYALIRLPLSLAETIIVTAFWSFAAGHAGAAAVRLDDDPAALACGRRLAAARADVRGGGAGGDPAAGGGAGDPGPGRGRRRGRPLPDRTGQPGGHDRTDRRTRAQPGPGRGVRGRRAPADRAGPARRCPAAAGVPGHEPRAGPGPVRGRPGRGQGHHRPGPRPRPSRPSPSCATWSAACTRRCCPTGAWTPRSPAWPRSARCRSPCRPAWPDRPTPSSEAIAYFVVAEALTNVAKHARATQAEVTVSRHGDAAARGHPRRRRRRRRPAAGRAWPAWPTAWPAWTGGCPCAARRGARL